MYDMDFLVNTTVKAIPMHCDSTWGLYGGTPDLQPAE
jgi:hypothetical protein